MTIAELIELLSKCDPSAEAVLYKSFAYGLGDVCEWVPLEKGNVECSADGKQVFID